MTVMNFARSMYLNLAVCSLMLAADPAPLPIEVPVGVYQRGVRYDVAMQVPFELNSLNTLSFQHNSDGLPIEAKWYYVNRVKLDDAMKAALAIPGFQIDADLREDGLVFKVARNEAYRFKCRLSVAAENSFGMDKVEGSVTNGNYPLPIIRVETTDKTETADADPYQFPDPGCLFRPYPGMDRIITGRGMLTSCLTQCLVAKDGVAMSYIMFFAPTITKDAYISEFKKRYPEFTQKQEGAGIALQSAYAKGLIYDVDKGYFLRLDRILGAKPRPVEGSALPMKEKAKK